MLRKMRARHLRERFVDFNGKLRWSFWYFATYLIVIHIVPSSRNGLLGFSLKNTGRKKLENSQENHGWRFKQKPFYCFQEGTVTNPAIWLVLSAVRIFLSLTTVTVTAGNSASEPLVLWMNYRWSSICPFLHFHGGLINGSLSLFTFK